MITTVICYIARAVLLSSHLPPPPTHRPSNKASHSLTSTPTVCLSLLPSAPLLGNISLLTTPARRKNLQHSSRADCNWFPPLQPSLQPTDFTCVSPLRCAECDKYRSYTEHQHRNLPLPGKDGRRPFELSWARSRFYMQPRPRTRMDACMRFDWGVAHC